MATVRALTALRKCYSLERTKAADSPEIKLSMEKSAERVAILPRADTSFAYNVLKLATGTGSSQIVGILAAPVIARLFSPAAFGDAAVFTSITAVIGIIVCLRYELAIMLPEKDELAINVLALSLMFVLVITSLTALLAFAGRKMIVRSLGAEDFNIYLTLAPIAVLLGGIFLALRSWSIRKKKFGLLSTAQALTTTIGALAQICFGFMGYTTGQALIIAGLIGLAISDLALVFGCWRKSHTVFAHVCWQSIRYAVTRFVRFPKYGTTSAVLNTLSWQSPAFFLAVFFSPAVVGEYSLGNRLLRVPMNLIGINIASVFFQRASEAKQQGTLAKSVAETFRYLVALTLFPCLLLTFIGKDLFLVVFGPKWTEAGVYSQILSVWVCFWFISSPLSMILEVLEEQALELKINILVLGSRVLSLLAGGLIGSPRVALGLFAATGVIVYGYYALVILDRSGILWGKMAKILLTNFALFLPAGMLIAALKYFDARPIVILIVSSLLLVLYYSNLLRTDPPARDLWRSLVGKAAPVSAGAVPRSG
jgi:lipopolysaccharide exporter